MLEKLDIQRVRSHLRARSTIRRNHMGQRRYSDGDDDNTTRHMMPTLSGKKSSPTIRPYNSKNLLLIADELDLPPPPAGGPPYNVEPPLPPLPSLPPSARSSKQTPPPSEPSNSSFHTTTRSSTSDRIRDFDLAPPPPNRPINTVDGLAQLLFSPKHLRLILGDPSLFLNFTQFLNRYKPHTAPVLIRYLETQKAIKAVEYANAVAETIQPLPGEHSSLIPCAAALVDGRFETRNRRAFESLVRDALPAYITHTLVNVVTEIMVKTITGTTIPVMRELVGGVAEVFCLTDSGLKDNPIVYASEEFYRTTQYGRDYVIGRNCRFLQGPQTERQSIARLSQALQHGQEVCETVLNYRRDGSPFLNLLMCAPLYDDRGEVRYFIGAQVDVSGLIEGGRGLESFETLLSEERARNSLRPPEEGKKSLKKLKELSQLFCLEEGAVVQTHSRSNSLRDDTSSTHRSIRGGQDHTARPTRRVIGEDRADNEHSNTWALSSLGPSGKLPGVYQNYLLVRPSPSLRIIFVSPALRIPGLLQSSLPAHIGGRPHVRNDLCDALAAGVAVTAKITWLPRARPQHHNDGSSTHPNGEDASKPSHTDDSDDASSGPSEEGGRPRWISCTPLFGSDDRVGVWMVVMVENERISGSLPSRGRRPLDVRSISLAASEREREEKERELDRRRRRARSRRSGERGYGGSGSGSKPGSAAGMPAVGIGAGVASSNGVGSDSGKWFAGFPNPAPSQGPENGRRRSSKESASTGGGTGTSTSTSTDEGG